MKSTIRALSLLLAMLMLVFCLAACNEPAAPLWENATYMEDQTLGEGEHTLTITVTVGERSIVLTLNTDEATVKDALAAHDLIDGEQQAIGYLMSTLNGIRADYTQDHAYWAFYQNGEYMMTGIDSTPITGDAAYEFVYTLAS